MSKTVRIAGIRGIPASHGGFETFCQRLAQRLVKDGWDVTVYCQEEGDGPTFVDEWQGVRRVRIPVSRGGALGTIIFDWKCIRHAMGSRDPVLILGYNTGVFAALLRLRGIPVIFNMDGVEWARAKWPWYARIWLFLNDLAASWLGNRLIADHPEIAAMLHKRVPRRKVLTIPYGVDAVAAADESQLSLYGLTASNYLLLIARPERENSILEIVRAYASKPRSIPLVILGAYQPEVNPFHREVLEAANEQVRFLGPIFDQAITGALRYYARIYIHGHQVGGTNPSLVESLAAGNAVIAHDNKFNRWCAGKGGRYFDGESRCASLMDELIDAPETLAEMRAHSLQRHSESFGAESEYRAYADCLGEWTQVDAEQEAGKANRLLNSTDQ